MKHVRTIIFRNFISPISIAIFVLAGGLLYLGETRDAWFISFVILVNSAIGSIQEIRAYLTLKKIELMSQPRARVLREGDFIEVLFSDLKVGEVIQLKTGDEIPADAKVINSNSFEIDEAILTGESLPIIKQKGEEILAGSIVVSGEATAKVIAVGDETHSGKMAKRLKKYKPSLTPIQKNIASLISIMTYFAIFLAIAVAWRYAHLGNSHIEILKTITSSAVVVVPEGLLLASSLLFAYGSIRLLQAKVLPQKISAIEDMALLEVLATDKTGTLTSPEIEFDDLEILNKEYSEDKVSEILIALNSQNKDPNATARAILKKFHKKSKLKILDFLAFSSKRKFSGLTFEDNKIVKSVVFGAPEFILKEFSDSKQADVISEKINLLARKGLRVLLLAERNKDEKFSAIAIITLKNQLRSNVQKTVNFLQERGVSIRVISGDNPHTVSFIAKEAGVDGYDKFVTGSDLLDLSDEDFEKTILNNAIFARVLPEQKEKIINVFKKNNLYTGMIGDGVNDALAIKTANLGISMFDAAPATRRVADLVLMDNSFTSLPDGVKIGGRIMLAIEMIAILFFHKIILGVTILFITLTLGVDYPFLPRHITYMNFILVTLPTILITLFPPLPMKKVNPKEFWQDTLKNIAPVAVLSGVAVSFIYIAMLSNFYNPSKDILRAILSTVVIVAVYFGVFVTILGEKMLNSELIKNTFYRRSLYILITMVFTVGVFGLKIVRNFFEFELPNFNKVGFILIVVFITSMIQFAIMRKNRDR